MHNTVDKENIGILKAVLRFQRVAGNPCFQPIRCHLQRNDEGFAAGSDYKTD